jgi:hypothetical protein
MGEKMNSAAVLVIAGGRRGGILVVVVARVGAVVRAIGQTIVLVVPCVVMRVRLLETDLLVQFGRYGGQSKQHHAGREQGGESGL